MNHTQNTNNQILYLIRGLPGSGKTTRAKLFQYYIGPEACIHCEADHWFEREGKGYQFNPHELPRAHQECQLRAFQALAQGQSVVVANTFTRERELAPYRKMAQQLGVEVMEDTMPDPGTDVLVARNIHNVPKEVIDRMRDRWEK